MCGKKNVTQLKNNILAWKNPPYNVNVQDLFYFLQSLSQIECKFGWDLKRTDYIDGQRKFFVFVEFPHNNLNKTKIPNASKKYATAKRSSLNCPKLFSGAIH